MSHNYKGGEMFHIESVRLSINEHMASVREEISCVVNERLTSVEQFMFSLFQREIETLVETLLERRDKLLDVHVSEKDFLHLPVCREEVSPEQQERSSSLVQEEPEPPHIKYEQEELLQRPGEADGSTLTLLVVKSEVDDESIETEPVAGTSTEHMNTQADVEYWGASQPISDDQLLSALCSESSAEAGDDWEETIEGQSALKTLKSHTRQRFPLSNKLSQHLKPSKQSHSMSSYRGKKIFTCKVCGKNCTHRGHLNYHMRTHTGEKPYACTVCGKGFGQRSHLKDHMPKHTGEKPYTCKVCGKGWTKKRFLKHHACIDVSHERQERSPSLVQEIPERPHIKEEQDDLFQRPEEADGSTMTLLAVKIEGYDEIRETEHLASSQPMKTQDIVQACGTSQLTGDDQLLALHGSESGTGDRDELWETSEGLSTLNPSNPHKRQTHLYNRLSQDVKLSKQTHSTRSRTGKMTFTCTVCGKSCSHKGHLNYHMKTHTGEKPFTCTVCGQGFGQRGNLKEHMVKHTGEKLFTCKVCGKGCGRKADLKVHMMIHTGEKPFTCTVCGKGCSHRGHLNYHMRSHSGEKPFTCPVCGKGCMQRSNLKVHMLIHTREKLLHGTGQNFH